MDVSKQTINYHDCKVSCHRLDRDIFRICPTKLSKRELEDLYYELTDANICLKKTINSQKEKVKMLSTKLLRMTAVQRVYSNKDSSCCSNVKLIVEEQKDCISELKHANDRLAEKVRQLNTKLCSAKQFLKRSPYHSTPRSKKTQSLKQSATSLNSKQSEINIRDPLQHIHEEDMPSPILAESTNRINRNEITLLKDEVSSRKPCENSKYMTEIEDLKQTISKLQLKLVEISQENANKLTHIEDELSRLKEENVQLRAERNAMENTLKNKTEEYRKCNMKIMDLETQCNDLTVELSLSKRRVSEMETRTKSAELSDQLLKTIDQHIANEEQRKNQFLMTKEFDYREGFHVTAEHSLVQKLDISTSPRKETSKENAANCTKDDKLGRKLEDSGFNEPVRNVTTTDDGKELLRLNQELIKKLAHLQNQLDSLQTSTIKPQQSKINQGNQILKITDESLPSNSKLQIQELVDEDNGIPEDIEVTTGFGHSTPIKTDSKQIRTIVKEKTGNYSDDFDTSNKESVKSIEKSSKALNKVAKMSPEYCKRSPSKIATNTSINKGDIPKPEVQIPKKEKDTRIKRNLLNTETYSVRKSEKNKEEKVSLKIKKDLSLDDTENDVSSLTSVEDDDKHTMYRLSIGERRQSSDSSETDSRCTSADYYCLSEGEVVLGQRLSVGESPLFRHRNTTRTAKEDQQPLSKSIEGTLKAITKELNLCGELLNFQPSAESPSRDKLGQALKEANVFEQWCLRKAADTYVVFYMLLKL